MPITNEPNIFDQFDDIPWDAPPNAVAAGTQPTAAPANAVAAGTQPTAAPANAAAASTQPAGFNERWGNLSSSAQPANFFDQFDEPPAGGAPANFFDQFDEPSPSGGAPITGERAVDNPGVMDRLQKVWDAPTPGGVVDIIKRVYTGLKGGAELTKDALQNGDMDDSVLAPKAFQTVGDLSILPTAAGANTVGATVRAAAPRAVDAALEAAERLGVAIPKYAGTDGGVLPRLAEGAKTVPWAGKPVEESAAKVSDDLANAVNMLARPSTPEVAGGAAKDALTDQIKVQGPQQVSGLYDTAENLMQDASPSSPYKVPLTNTAAKMQDIAAQRANAKLPEFSPAMKLLMNAATDPEGMNYAGIKMLRGALRENQPQQLIAEGIDPTVAKQLYAPLTQDLRAAVQATPGGPTAVGAWEQANALAASNAAQRKALYKIIGTKADASPELVFSRLVAMAGNKSTANLAGLEQAKDAMGPQAWKEVSNAVISRLGRDPQGNFSPDRFIGPSGYAGLSDAAKDVLFDRATKSGLDDVYSVSNLVKNKISKYANTSKTAHAGAAGALIGEGIGAAFHPLLALKLAAGLAGGRGVAYYLSRPAVSQATADLGRAYLRNAHPAEILAKRAALGAAVKNASGDAADYGYQQ